MFLECSIVYFYKTMKSSLVLLLLSILTVSQCTRKFCLEELQRDYPGDTSTINDRYARTGENVCFDLKTHVSRCLDRSLYSLVQIVSPEQLQSKKNPPKLSLETIEEALGHYMNVALIPSFKDYLQRCSHQGMITVGDFSKTCACDIGSDMDCIGYKHIGEMLQCNL